MPEIAHSYDLLIVGGGINGAGIARDAVGRGLSVLLVEAGDLAGRTSSASTKLIHGGLRYLEQYEFRLVREALAEREVLLGIAPHIIHPMRFVLPQPPAGRPGWMIRIGLFLYDHIGGRRSLAGSQAVRLEGTEWGRGLKPGLANGFVYSDCWVDDSRLVVLNARDAADRGATIATRTRFVSAERGDDWTVVIEADGVRRTITARAIVNAAGAAVSDVLRAFPNAEPERPPRLVKGSHIVVPRRFDGKHAYILQNPDGRIVFAIPYEREFTLIGTTDVTVEAGEVPTASDDEVRYLCDAVNAYLASPVAPADVLWSYSGVRPLYDDGAENAADVTRDYVLRLGFDGGPQLLSVFGGKITTYRRLAEHALDELKPFLPAMTPSWTGSAPLTGGDIGEFDAWQAKVQTRWPFLGDALALRLARAYGSQLDVILRDAASLADLGRDFGGGLTEAEVRHLVSREWARTADDILWRRTKLGLHTTAETRDALDAYLGEAV